MSQTSSRFFTGRQRTALYLAADGRCQKCGTALGPGWHADHVQAYALGGPTDVTNGQALCPDCNLRKGSRMTGTLRDWQRQAVQRWARTRTTNGSFLLVATPGAGKTRCALQMARDDLDAGLVNRVIVVAPSVELKKQWADAAADYGISLNPFWSGESLTQTRYDGVVVTYAQLVTSGTLHFRMLAGSADTLLIADEIHHCGYNDEGNNTRWGEALQQAFDGSTVRRLLLSGTPFRSDGYRIPFVTYAEQPGGGWVSQADFTYGYAQAVLDFVCRSIDFRTYDGQVRWVEAHEEEDECISEQIVNLAPDLDRKDRARALASALDTIGEYMPNMLAEADRALTAVRDECPNAGGLVIAYRQQEAREYATVLQRITGETPVVVLSDDDQAPANLERFRRSSQRWLVAVDMVSEGVDIPRLAVEVLATRKTTEMFFRQAIGRVIRRQGREDQTQAVVLMPRVEPFVTYARQLAAEQAHVFEENRRNIDKGTSSYPPDGSIFSSFTVTGSDAASFAGSLFSGDEFSPAEIAQAREDLRRVSMSEHHAVNFLQLMRMKALEEPRTRVVVSTQTAPPIKAQWREEEEKRQALTRLANKIAYAGEMEFSHVNGDVKRYIGKPRAQWAVADYVRAIAYLQNRYGYAS